MTRRLGLLMCGHVHPDALHLGGDYPELFAELFEPLDVEMVPYAVAEGRLPDSTTECDGWVTSPSRSSVTDDLEWIDDLAGFVSRAVAEEQPFIGVCFGHQLLAHALGGRVERAAVGWGVGVKEYEIVEQRSWMQPERSSIALVASHEDQVVEMPTGATLLATSQYCPIAAFELGERCIAIQPHIELTTEISAALIDLREDLIGAEIARAARSTLHSEPDRALVAGWFANFLGS